MTIRNTLPMLAAALGSAAALGAAESTLWKEGISLIPAPREARLTGGDFVFPAEVAVVVDKTATEADRFAAADLVERLRTDHGIAAHVGAGSRGPSIVLTRSGAARRVGEQGYELVADRNRVTVSANGEAGLYYGTRTLLQIVRKCRTGPCIAGIEIADWPDIPNRAVHYDTKHHQDKADYVREFIRTLADYKINLLVWEWEDKLAYRSHPEVGAPGAFTIAQMQEFTRYARKHHVQIVPLVQGLGHVSFILKWPQFANLREIAASNWEFCPRKEGSYRLLFDLWDEAMEATPGSEYIHIGTDETYELGLGVECGCRARMAEVGRYGLLMDFVERSASHLMAKGRKVISWGGEYRAGQKIRPPKGLITAEFGENLERAKAARDAGYPAWVYDPNPGIEHLFLPYLYRLDRSREVDNCLTNSHRVLAPAALSGLFDGMVVTSWDDSGLHNQVWMMRFVHAAEVSWNGAGSTLDEFTDRYFANYYGPQSAELKDLWTLLNKGAYYYMDTFERKVWHWGDVGKTHLPDLPRGDAVEYSPHWNREYREMVDRSRAQLPAMERVRNICRLNRQRGAKHGYDFEVFETIADLISHTGRTYLALAALENTIGEAHRQHFVSHQASYAAFEKAAALVDANLKERDKVFAELVAVWEKTRLPKGLSTPEKSFFHQQDRARHFAFRRADMSYLIWDEQRLGLEGYLKDLREYMDWYKKLYL